jgi:uncharacterized membrane protein YkoI
MAYRYVLAAALLAATSLPAAAQQTTQPDTSKKASTSGTTTTTSNGAVAEPPAAAAPNPNGPSATPGASINSPASTTAPSSTSPSTGTVTTSPAPTSGAASTSPSGVTSTPSDASTSGASTSSAMGATGQVQPTSGAVKVDVKVAPTLANSVKISADSAFALARASGTAGEISSAELEMKEKALVYNIKMVKGAGASVVHVDAMTGQVVKDKKYGGLKASAENDKQLRKLEDAKEDSTKARKP